MKKKRVKVNGKKITLEFYSPDDFKPKPKKLIFRLIPMSKVELENNKKFIEMANKLCRQ